jgi:hypothetical protein
MAAPPIPLWLIIPADAAEVDVLDMARFKENRPSWLLVPCKGVPHVAAFSSLEGAERFMSQFPHPEKYLNAEMGTMELRIALTGLLGLPVERLLLDGKLGYKIAELIKWLDGLPESRPDFGTP